LKKYTSYHTSIKHLAKQNKLPCKYSKYIDRSTIWRWKKEDDNKYLGSELSNIDLIEKFLARKESSRVIRSYLKVVTVFSRIISEAGHLGRILNQNKELFVRTILNHRNNINFKLVLRLCSVSVSVFHYWKHQVVNNCSTSPFRLCKRIYPNQLTQDEVSTMQSMLTEQRFRYWPVNSIAWYALRNNIVNVSLATWYNYINKLCWERPKLPKKSKYGIGIRGSRPHQVWHADITVVKCLNGIKYYVYLLMDNFSRFILNYQVSDKVSSTIRLDSIKQAYDKYIKMTGEDVRLIVDGGVENNNQAIDDYISTEDVSVRKLIAGKDIRFSNSIVEAQNKIIKYRYLFKHDFKDIHELRKLLDWIINDYQYERPHHSLKGLTPYEALTGIKMPMEQLHLQIQKSKQHRLIQNASERCEIC